MSGFILLLAPREKTEKISKFFYSDEVQTQNLGDKTLWFVSNSGKLQDGEIFQGYAMNHEKQKFIFSGACGLKEWLDKPLEGSYFFSTVNENEISCRADLYGLMPMVWFSENDIFAISNSYLSIIEIRRVLSLPNEFDPQGVAARLWSNAMGGTQLGRRTYCKNVRYAIPGSKLVVSVRDAQCSEEVLNYPEYYSSFFESHSEAIELTARRIVSTFKTYDSLNAAVALAISGGTDSRVCLAGALKSGIQENIKFGCNENGLKDYAVAQGLSESFGFELNAPLTVRSSFGGNDQAALWAVGSLGVYDQLYAPKVYRKFESIIFNVGGQGAEMAKGNYGWRKLADIVMPDEALAEGEESLQAMGVDAEDQWSAEWHYIAFRGALHSGRGSVFNDYLSRPAAQLPLVGLSHSRLNDLPAPRKSAKNIVQDVLIKISPELAAYPFDAESKNLSKDYISARLNKLDGPLEADSVEAYSIVGQPVLGEGVIKTQIRLAQNSGFTGLISPQNLYRRASAALDIYQELFPQDLVNSFNAVDGRDTKPFRASSKEANITGKLLALSLLA